LDESFDLFTGFVIGNAEHCCSGELGMYDEEFFRLQGETLTPPKRESTDVPVLNGDR
jgi:hypothetical protein